MSALDDGTLGAREITDLDSIAEFRVQLFNEDGYRLPLQDAEREAGLTEVDIWTRPEKHPALTGPAVHSRRRKIRRLRRSAS